MESSVIMIEEHKPHPVRAAGLPDDDPDTANLSIAIAPGETTIDDEADGDSVVAGAESPQTNDVALGSTAGGAIESDAPVFDPEALLAAIHTQIERAYEGNPFQPDPDVQLVAEITRTIQGLGRAGTRHVLDAGLGAMIEVTTTLIVRLQAAVAWHLNRIDQTEGGRNGHLILNIPPEIQNLMPPLADLGLLLVRLTDCYSKFQHLNALAGDRHEKH